MFCFFQWVIIQQVGKRSNSKQRSLSSPPELGWPVCDAFIPVVKTQTTDFQLPATMSSSNWWGKTCSKPFDSERGGWIWNQHIWLQSFSTAMTLWPLLASWERMVGATTIWPPWWGAPTTFWEVPMQASSYTGAAFFLNDCSLMTTRGYFLGSSEAPPLMRRRIFKIGYLLLEIDPFWDICVQFSAEWPLPLLFHTDQWYTICWGRRS